MSSKQTGQIKQAPVNLVHVRPLRRFVLSRIAHQVAQHAVRFVGRRKPQTGVGDARRHLQRGEALVGLFAARHHFEREHCEAPRVRARTEFAIGNCFWSLFNYCYKKTNNT